MIKGDKMSEEDKKVRVNLNIDHGQQAFFADRVTVSHFPNKFVIDFTQALPRFDVVGDQPQQTLVVKHNPIIMDPNVVKEFVRVLTENMDKYEKNVAKVSMPKQSKQKKSQKATMQKTTSDASSRYIG